MHQETQSFTPPPLLRAHVSTDRAAWCFVPIDAVRQTKSIAAGHLFDAPAPEPLAAARQMWELEQTVVLNESGQLRGELLRLQESSPGVPSADLAREQLQKLSPRKTEVFELVL